MGITFNNRDKGDRGSIYNSAHECRSFSDMIPHSPCYSPFHSKSIEFHQESSNVSTREKRREHTVSTSNPAMNHCNCSSVNYLLEGAGHYAGQVKKSSQGAFIVMIIIII